MDKKEQPEPNPSKMTPEQRQLLREKAREVADLWNRKFKPPGKPAPHEQPDPAKGNA